MNACARHGSTHARVMHRSKHAAEAAVETAKDEAETGGMEPEPQPQEGGIPSEVAVQQAHQL